MSILKIKKYSFIVRLNPDEKKLLIEKKKKSRLSNSRIIAYLLKKDFYK